MGLNCGIVGLPNVGKSTIFSAVTAAPAEAANYPFCTIEPNTGVVSMPDKRLDNLSALFNPKKTVPAIVEFVDIAGLVGGASKGEGLGNKFLSHIRQVGVIAHVVRCFEDGDIVHVSGKVDPASDIETINIELALADLETVEKRKLRAEKMLKSKDSAKEAKMELEICAVLSETLGNGKPARSVEFNADQLAIIRDMHLITMKKQLYVCNVDEESVKEGNQYSKIVEEIAAKEGSAAIVVCGKLESEISMLETEEERAEFLEMAGLEESGLVKLIHAAYNLLGLRTFFTAGEDECRAWTFHDGDKAPQAAGVIHTDFEKGFIKAEVYSYDDIMELKTEQQIKLAGKLRIEGKEYVVKDGDVMHFRFNV